MCVFSDHREYLQAHPGDAPLNRAFRNMDLAGANLAVVDLRRADLSGANLAGAYLSRAALDGADLSGANLTGAMLSGASLMGATLRKARMGGVRAFKATFKGADLSGAFLAHANLRDATLCGVRMIGADLTRASLVRASFAGAEFVNTTFKSCEGAVHLRPPFAGAADVLAVQGDYELIYYVSGGPHGTAHTVLGKLYRSGIGDKLWAAYRDCINGRAALAGRYGVSV